MHYAIVIAGLAFTSYVHYLAIATIWRYIYFFNPVGDWAFRNLVESVWFWPTIFLNDLAINAILFLPGAYLVALATPRHVAFDCLPLCVLLLLQRQSRGIRNMGLSDRAISVHFDFDNLVFCHSCPTH